MNIAGIVMAVIAVVIAVVLVPTIWDAVYWDSAKTAGTGLPINGTTWTLLKLVPLIFVGVTVFGTILYAIRH